MLLPMFIKDKLSRCKAAVAKKLLESQGAKLERELLPPRDLTNFVGWLISLRSGSPLHVYDVVRDPTTQRFMIVRGLSVSPLCSKYELITEFAKQRLAIFQPFD